jgi:hypothetical protein
MAAASIRGGATIAATTIDTYTVIYLPVVSAGGTPVAYLAFLNGDPWLVRLKPDPFDAALTSDPVQATLNANHLTADLQPDPWRASV